MQDSPTHGRKQRQKGLEYVTVAAGENRNIARRRAVATARDRAVGGLCAAGGNELPEASYLGRVGRTHLRPNLARPQACYYAIVGFHDRGTNARAWQTGNDDVDAFRQFSR